MISAPRRLVALLLAIAGTPAFAASIPDEYRIGGFAVGPQAFSFRFFTLFEAIEKTQKAGAKVIELGVNMKLSPERQVAFNHDAPAELIPLVQEKLKQHCVKAVNYGVVRIPDEATARKVFDFARTMGFSAIITESIDSLDLIEKFAREYDINVGIHQHARKP